MSSSSLLWDGGQRTGLRSWWGHGRSRDASVCMWHVPARVPKCSTRELGWNDLEENRTYDVRLRFWRARGLLSTSGGILFATVSGECTRNAKSVVAIGGLARLPMKGDATGSGDEGDISSNNRDDKQTRSDCIKSQPALDIEASNRKRIGGRECCTRLASRVAPAGGCKTSSTALSLVKNSGPVHATTRASYFCHTSSDLDCVDC